MPEFQRIASSKQLPDAWDRLATTYFQKRAFLSYLEKYNPCHQRYYLAYVSNELASVAVVYTRQIDLLTFLKIHSPLQMHIVGIPCSVSSPGIFGDHQVCVKMRDHIYQSEKGLCLFLNLLAPLKPTRHLNGTTLPSIVLNNKHASWYAYMHDLRADYRRRLIRIMQGQNGQPFTKLECCTFSQEMYDNYYE